MIRWLGLMYLLPLFSLCAIARQASADALWPSDCLTKIMRSDRPGPGARDALNLYGARGEIVSGQVVVLPEADRKAVSASMTDLRQTSGNATIPATAIQLQWVRYIDVDRNSEGIPADELIAKAPTTIPDPYWEGSTIPVKADQSQPLWIEIHIPRTAAAGAYAGTLTVAAADQKLTLPVSLRVRDFDMPEERHLSVVNWWRFPGLGLRDRVKPYSDEYWKLLGEFCAFLVEHRQTDVNTSIGLITESGDEQKGYTHDTSRLERYAEIAFNAGIRQIQLHSVGRRTAPIVDPTSRIQAVEPNLRRLVALDKVIQRRNWSNRFAVSISDEPFVHHEETFTAIVDRVHEIAPHVRCIEAVETDNLGELDIYVPKLSHLNLWYPRFDQVRRDGAELWYYTCCHPTGRYPNRFLDQSLLKVRVLHWINYLYDLDGYLHWGLNHVHGSDGYSQEGISKDLPLGDRAIVYPGKKGLIGSLRFSTQRDGLQDFEYLWVLEDRLRQIKQRVGDDAHWLDPRQRSLELCRRVVQSFHDYTRDSDTLLETRRTIAEEIEALALEPLLVVQTSPSEGTELPAGPRHVIVRGLTTPGAKVTLNGKEITNVKPTGYFYTFRFMPDDQPTITITAEHENKQVTAKRTFNLTD